MINDDHVIEKFHRCFKQIFRLIQIYRDSASTDPLVIPKISLTVQILHHSISNGASLYIRTFVSFWRTSLRDKLVKTRNAAAV